MVRDWDIGREARELDKLSIKERIKLEKKTVMKMAASTGIYFIVMLILYLLL